MSVSSDNATHLGERTDAPLFPSRRITDHKLNGLNDAIEIKATDQPGSGGANHHYSIVGRNVDGTVFVADHIRFQEGPIQEAGFNGLSNEALLAVVIDRMRGFQGGQYACRENALALTNLEQALMWLQKRTRDRLARGVEGTHQK